MTALELQPRADAQLATSNARMLEAVQAVYADGRRALAEVVAPADVTVARDRVAAMEDVLRRAVRDRAERLYAQNLLAELRLRQERWLGDWLSAHINHTGGGDRKSRKRNGTAAGDLPAGISKNQSSVFQRLSSVAEGAFERYISDTRDAQKEITTSGALRFGYATNVRRSGHQPGPAGVPECAVSDLSELIKSGNQFGTVYVDPPWAYDNEASRGAASGHYPTLSVDALAELPVGELAAVDSHLHLWTTNAFLFECPRLLAAWGFDYKGVFVWVKPQMGLGNYWREGHEFLVLGVRGRSPFRDRSIASWLEAPRTRHTEKPEEIRALIERASPGPYLELFGRRQAPGWVVWGDEIPQSILDAALNAHSTLPAGFSAPSNN